MKDNSLHNVTQKGLLWGWLVLFNPSYKSEKIWRKTGMRGVPTRRRGPDSTGCMGAFALRHKAVPGPQHDVPLNSGFVCFT